MNYSHPEPFRLLEHYDIYGPLSMALDTVLIQNLRNDHTLAPVLRLHRFSQPMLTVGNDKHKIMNDLDLDALIRDDVSLTVRPSAGSPTLTHDQELCFTLITCKRHWDNFGVLDMFEHINRILCEFFNELGIDARLVDDRHELRRCADNLEVIAPNGRKLVGSGLMTKPSVYSQEGVIPLDRSFREVGKYVTGRDNEIFCTKEGELYPTSLAEEGVEVDFEQAAGLLVETFGDIHPLERSSFTEQEVANARKMLATTYHRPEQWLA